MLDYHIVDRMTTSHTIAVGTPYSDSDESGILSQVLFGNDYLSIRSGGILPYSYKQTSDKCTYNCQMYYRDDRDDTVYESANGATILAGKFPKRLDCPTSTTYTNHTISGSHTYDMQLCFCSGINYSGTCSVLGGKIGGMKISFPESQVGTYVVYHCRKCQITAVDLCPWSKVVGSQIPWNSVLSNVLS